MAADSKREYFKLTVDQIFSYITKVEIKERAF